MSFVLDASCACAWLFEDNRFQVALPALHRLQTDSAVVPALWRFEVASTAKKSIGQGKVSVTQARSFLADLETFDIREEPRLPRALDLLDLGLRLDLTPYDVAYIQLAKRMQLPLATFDRQMIRAALQEGVDLMLNVTAETET